MNLSLENYIILSYYLRLPLPAIKYIDKRKIHPFHNIEKLNEVEIIQELKKLNRLPFTKIKVLKPENVEIKNLIPEGIFSKIIEDINIWKDKKINISTFLDNINYPPMLKVIKNPPRAIFYRGEFEPIDKEKTIAIIGTRKPTAYGFSMAKKIGKRFAELNFTIVNGFAKGVDIQALNGSLEIGGRVIGVLGSGILNPYPRENIEILEDIIKNHKGVILSEVLPEAPVTKAGLVTRNRISSALSLGNVFIEGDEKSGIRHQLRYGKQQGKPIIVLKPKDKNSRTAFIPNQIIKNEKNVVIIEKIEDVDKIAEKIINLSDSKKQSSKGKKKSMQTSLEGFLK